MGRRTIGLLAFALALASCTGDTAGTSTTSEVSTTATTTASTTTTTTTPLATDPGGRLVILDGSGDVVVIDPDGSNRTGVTDNAGDTAAYTQPIWSPDGQSLAFGQIDAEEGFSVGIHDLAATETTSISTGNLPFYMSFSPRGDQIGVLHNGTAGIDFNLVDVGTGTIEKIDSGAPYYFSWSPASDQLVTHVGVDRVETIDSEGERLPLEPTGPMYLAPQWTDLGVFHVVNDALVLEGEDGERGTVAVVSGLTMFVANPQGTRVAIQSATQDGPVEAALSDPPGISANQVTVVDVSTGETHVVGDELALGFFWSPDGEKLLSLMPEDPGVEAQVWTIDGSVIEYPAFVPPTTMLQDTFPFFPQYAQSVRFWSPDSSAFAYAGALDGEAGIWVQPLDRDTPEMVSEGRWVAWSGS